MVPFDNYKLPCNKERSHNVCMHTPSIYSWFYTSLFPWIVGTQFEAHFSNPPQTNSYVFVTSLLQFCILLFVWDMKLYRQPNDVPKPYQVLPGPQSPLSDYTLTILIQTCSVQRCFSLSYGDAGYIQLVSMRNLHPAVSGLFLGGGIQNPLASWNFAITFYGHVLYLIASKMR